jgi:hypothetical protein
MDLRHATKAIGILHTGRSITAGGIDIAAFEKGAEAGGGNGLPQMGAGFVNTAIKGNGSAEEGLEG